ncbi:phosphoribosyltransferase-like protein [Bradyrhizobium guangdongense]
MAVKPDLLAQTVSIIADYRKGEIAEPDIRHVERWLNQFDEGIREKLITELNGVLTKTYISRSTVNTFLENLVVNAKLTNGDPKQFWQATKFLDIQSRGSSQHELTQLIATPLKRETGLTPDKCGSAPACYVYLDDGLYTGNTIITDLSKWLVSAPQQAIVHVILIALHRGGQYYAQGKLNAAAKSAGKAITFHWWRIVELEDRLTYINSADVLRPTKLPEDPVVAEYVEAMRHKPVWRTPGGLGDLKLFSSEDNRSLIEQQFLVKGAHIRKNSPRLPTYARPLGNMVLETLGFGSTIVTFRNCPNNAPLAFWAGNPWYPLFPRKTN